MTTASDASYPTTLIVEYLDGETREFVFHRDDKPGPVSWRPTRTALIIKQQGVGNRTVIPLYNVRSYALDVSPEPTRLDRFLKGSDTLSWKALSGRAINSNEWTVWSNAPEPRATGLTLENAVQLVRRMREDDSTDATQYYAEDALTGETWVP